MKAAVALAVSITLIGCFPNNARHRTYAKYAEGTALVAGIIISAVSNTGADCDKMAMAGVEDNCRDTAKYLGTAGLILIVGGLLGFVATISTAEDEESTPRVLSVEKKEGSGSADGSGAGSAAGSGSAAAAPTGAATTTTTTTTTTPADPATTGAGSAAPTTP